MDIEEYSLLAPRTTFRVGGVARYFTRVRDDAHLHALAALAERTALPVVVIGGGANMLIDDEGFDGIITQVAITDVDWYDHGRDTLVVVGAGASWDAVVSAAVARDLWGIENLSGIPGTMGGAVVQNIGAYGAELANALEWVEAFHLPSRRVQRLTGAECAFGYRESIWKHSRGSDLIILRAALRLSINGTPNISYKDLRNVFQNARIDMLRPSDIRHAVMKIRREKFPDLAHYGTAGSFFKNPIVSHDILARLLEQFPDMPVHFLPTGKPKLSAAWLIDKVAGFRGKRMGSVGTWPAQALVVVNYGGATAREIHAFTQMIRHEVHERTGVRLEEEVVIITHV